MNDLLDREAEQLASAFRPNRKPLWIAVAANLLLAVAFLGVPYWRGRAVSLRARSAFADTAACLFGGEVAARGGLALPLGDEEHYAGLVMRGAPDWPARCLPALARVAPEEATFLWPSVKQASADLRAAVELTRTELGTLITDRKAGHGRVPVRPMLALDRLRAALTLLTQAVGDTTGVDDNAIRFSKPGLATVPARMPLGAGNEALLQLWGAADGVEATALDGRGLSWLRLVDGKLDRFRLASGALVRATLRLDDQSFVVWAMAPDRCAARDDRCSKRASGIAALPMGVETLPEPAWLGGHPAGRPDRVFGVRGHEVTLLARHGIDSEVELRRFTLPALPNGDRPLSPERRSAATPRALDAVLVSAVRGDYAYLGQDAGLQRAILSRDFGTQEVLLSELQASEGPTELQASASWIAACVAEDSTWLAFGGTQALRVSRVTESAAVTSAPIALGASDSLHESRPLQDRVKLRCTSAGLDLVVLDDSNQLRLAQCDATVTCTAPQTLADEVIRFDALALPDAVLVAYTGLGVAADIRTRRITTKGAEPELRTAPCWDPTGGFCGQPQLVLDHQRVLLVAREGADLLLVESLDDGKRWQTASGLQVYDAADTGNSAPMDQHRLRKGLK